MFLQEEIIPDNRPLLAVYASGADFLYKYFDRRFDMRVTSNLAEVSNAMAAFLIVGTEFEDRLATDKFKEECNRINLPVITLHVPFVIGTGMTETPMRMARGVMRGLLMKIKDNTAKWSVIHAVDIANVAFMLYETGVRDSEFTISPEAVAVNDLIEALSIRIKDKRVAVISPRWARLLYGKDYFERLTTDHLVDSRGFTEQYPDFEFINPADYLKTHNYDNESL